MAESLKERLDRLHHLKRRAQRLNRLAEEAKRMRDDLQAALHEEMGQVGFDSIKTGLARFERRSTLYGVVYDQDAFEAWCRENGEEEAYLRVRPESGRINELVRMATQNKEALPPGLGSYPKDYITVTDRKDD